MLFKTYQKLLGASCLALYLVGCGSGGGTESPVEIEKNDFNSTLKIISKADNVEIQDLKLNRGNCWHNGNLLKELMQRTANVRRSVAEQEKAIKNHQAVIAGLQKDLEELTQWVQSFNTFDKLWENIFYALRKENQDKLLSRTLAFGVPWNFRLIFYDQHDPISRTKKNDLSLEELMLILDNIRSVIKDTKNPKDYHYINLKELKKLIDSIVSSDDFMVRDGSLFESDKVSEKGLQRLAKLKSM
ncbi:putative uncharacterized protein [Helicobacter pylori]|nr:putative uncharacterized protein [Helicobacter pylori]